jgi:hypothetical protein
LQGRKELHSPWGLNCFSLKEKGTKLIPPPSRKRLCYLLPKGVNVTCTKTTKTYDERINLCLNPKYKQIFIAMK